MAPKSIQAETTPPPSDEDLFAQFSNLSTPKEPAKETPPKNVPFTQVDEPIELPTGTTKGRNTALKKSLEETYALLGTSVFMFDQQIGLTIIQKAPDCAAALDELARTNPAVKKALMKLMETSVYAAVISAHAPIVVAVATKYVPYLRDSYEQTVENSNTEAPAA